MDDTLEAKLDALAQFPILARDLLLEVTSDEAMVDVLGSIRSAEIGLAEVRKMGASEITDGTRGDRFSFSQSPVSTKTYNMDSLLAKFILAWGVGPLDVLRRLVEMDVIRLSWQYKKLLAAARTAQVNLITSHNEVSDGDEHDIGRVWKDGYPSYKGIEHATEKEQT